MSALGIRVLAKEPPLERLGLLAKDDAREVEVEVRRLHARVSRAGHERDRADRRREPTNRAAPSPRLASNASTASGAGITEDSELALLEAVPWSVRASRFAR